MASIETAQRGSDMGLFAIVWRPSSGALEVMAWGEAIARAMGAFMGEEEQAMILGQLPTRERAELMAATLAGARRARA